MNAPAMATAPAELTIETIVRRMTYETPSVLSYDLQRADGGALPGFEPGAHIDVHLPDGLVRQYSLVGPADGKTYRIAVALDRATRGGSRWLHSGARPGDRLTISAPRTTFALAETVSPSVLFAGGIGITPILAMARQLAAKGLPWRLYYGVRTRAECALIEELQALGGAVHIHIDDEDHGFIDIAHLVGKAAPDTHFYCCGPAPMLAAFKAATAGHDPDRVHWESFLPAVPEAGDGGFTVVLDRTGRSVVVGADQTILEAIEAAGIAVPSSCRNGICGTCETRVLEGTPDHRDKVLSDDEKAEGATMMICCSRAKTALLRLDR